MKIKGTVLVAAIEKLKKIFYEKDINQIRIMSKEKCCVLFAMNSELEVAVGVFGEDTIWEGDLDVVVADDSFPASVKAINDKSIMIDIKQDGDKLVLTGNGTATVAISKETLPIKWVGKDAFISVNSMDLSDAFKANAIASNAKSKIGLSSMVKVSYNKDAGTLNTMSSDGKVLCTTETSYEDEFKEAEFSHLISASAASAISGILSLIDGDGEDINISEIKSEDSDDVFIGLRGKTVVFCVKTIIENKYPTFSTLLDIPYQKRFVVEKKSFINMLRSIYRAMPKEDNFKCEISVSDSSVTVKTSNAMKNMDISNGPVEFKTTLNIALLIEMCNAIQYPDISVWISENDKLFRVTPSNLFDVQMIAGTLQQ